MMTMATSAADPNQKPHRVKNDDGRSGCAAMGATAGALGAMLAGAVCSVSDM
jgi:hypothetical protein